MTTRTFDKPDQTVPLTREAYTYCGHSSPAVTYGNGLVRRERGSYTGVSTPHYYKKVKRGELLPLNAYRRWDYLGAAAPGNVTASGCSCSGGKFSVTYTNAGIPGYHLWAGNKPVLPSNFWEGVDSDALIAAAMADILPDLDALTTAVEAKKTIMMVVNARKDAKRLIREALRGGKHTVKAASDAWLAWRYGWEQLGYDILNVASLIKEPFRGLILTGQSGKSTKTSSSGSGVIYTGSDFVRGENWTIYHDFSHRARVLCRWKGQTVNALIDPLVTIWETIPYSWVADWFVNVGDILAAWDVSLRTEQLRASLGVQYTGTSTAEYWVTPADCTSVSGSGTTTETILYRERIPASIPSLVPSFTVRLTSERILDAAALLAKRIL